MFTNTTGRRMAAGAHPDVRVAPGRAHHRARCAGGAEARWARTPTGSVKISGIPVRGNGVGRIAGGITPGAASTLGSRQHIRQVKLSGDGFLIGEVYFIRSEVRR